MARKSGRASAQRRARKRTPKTTFPFMQLAGETRNEIYRALLDDLTTPSTEFNACSEKLPQYENLAMYLALLRVSRVVGLEVRSMFEKEYAADLVIYFRDLRKLWRSALSPGFKGLRDSGAKYLLRAPVGRDPGLGYTAASAIVGQRNGVSQLDMPYEGWTVLEHVLVQGVLDDERTKTWTLDRNTKIQVTQVLDDVYCTIHLPLRRQLGNQPTLTFFSHLTLGQCNGHTTSTIGGKLQDLALTSVWHTSADVKKLEGCMDQWAAGVCHGRRIRWAFDSPELAADFVEMYEREGWGP